MMKCFWKYLNFKYVKNDGDFKRMYDQNGVHFDNIQGEL